jgi:hypothetical protein
MLTCKLFYPQGKSPQYMLDSRLVVVWGRNKSAESCGFDSRVRLLDFSIDLILPAAL